MRPFCIHVTMEHGEKQPRNKFGGEGLPQAAESKGWQTGQQNIYKWKTCIFCAQQILNYWYEYKKIQQIIVLFKFVISTRGSHYDYLPQTPRNLSIPLLSTTGSDAKSAVMGS